MNWPEFYSYVREFVKRENYSLDDGVVTAISDFMMFEYVKYPDRDNTTAVRQGVINVGVILQSLQSKDKHSSRKMFVVRKHVESCKQTIISICLNEVYLLM